MQSLLILIIKIFTTKNRDLFIIRLGSALMLKQWGIAGSIPSYVLRSIMGAALEAGVFYIDIGLDAYKEGQKLEEFKIEAKKAHDLAIAKVYSEAEKEAIREKYRKIIEGIAPVGSHKPNN